MFNQQSESIANFQSRIWIFDNDPLDLKVFCYEFDPMTSTSRHAEEWIEEHLQGLGEDDLRERFDLPKEGNFQVLITGKIRGWWDYWGEYDEEIEFSDIKTVPIPEEYLKNMHFES